jgi:EpsI family protein
MIAKGRFIIVYVLLAAAGLYINVHADITVPMNRPLSEFPTVVGEWKMVSQTTFDDSTLKVLKPTDYLSRVYDGSNGRQAQLYIGYHGGGKDGGEIHSPKHCLPGSGWYEASTKKTRLDVGGKNINLMEAVYQKGDSKELFLYWFQVKDASITSEYRLKVAEIVNSMLSRRRDASFIRMSVPVQGSLEQATATGEQFVRDLYPAIREHLPM